METREQARGQESALLELADGEFAEECGHGFTIQVSGEHQIVRQAPTDDPCKYSDEDLKAARKDARKKLKAAVEEECDITCPERQRCAGVVTDQKVTYTTRGEGTGQHERCSVVCTIVATGKCECRPKAA